MLTRPPRHQVSVFLARCLVVYVVNGAIVACREGRVSVWRVRVKVRP